VRRSSEVLSQAQLDLLAEHGEERTADAGEILFEVGDKSYPFMAILEGEVAIRDESGHELIRHGAAGFVGELNLLTGQTVFLRAIVTQPTRYIAIDRMELRALLFENPDLADLLLPAFVSRRELLQSEDGLGIEVIGPRSSERTRGIVEWLRSARIPYRWRDPEHPERDDEGQAGALIDSLTPERLPLIRIPGGLELQGPTNGELSRALGIGLELASREEVDLLIVGGGPAGLGAAVYASSEALATLVLERTVLGGQAGFSRRIENYLGFPAGIGGGELTSRAVTQARKFGARTATPYVATALEPDGDRHIVRVEDGNEIAARAVVIATGAQYRRPACERLPEYEGISVFYAAGPPEARRCGGSRVGVVGGGNSAAQAAIWLARGGALVTLLHRRADLSETMSDYLIRDLDRYGVQVRDRSEIARLHGGDGELEAVTLTDGERIQISNLFLFLGADPCTEWLGEDIARDEHGFLLTGPDAGTETPLETNVPGLYAVGDVRSGSAKRVATAVGEGAMVVRFVHDRLGRPSPVNVREPADGAPAVSS
jgi:thioredoxin reductase (NADPH)